MPRGAWSCVHEKTTDHFKLQLSEYSELRTMFYFCTTPGCTAPPNALEGTPPSPLVPNFGDGSMTGFQRHVCVRPLGVKTASHRYESGNGRLGGRSAREPSPACTRLSSGSDNKENYGCRRALQNARKAKKIVKLLRVDQSLKVEGFGTRSALRLPPTVVCGTLRKTVRSMYAPGLSPVQELSIKTSSKVEGSPCSFCTDLMQESKLMDYYSARQIPQPVDEDHLERFGRMFAQNVPRGWNNRKSPYVPNGHATSAFPRSAGGNWNSQEFSDECSVKLVFSAGKPRVVTMYSSYNVEVLTPLHNSLYNFLKRKEWLLVGPPTPERLRHLRAKAEGPEWLSFDYESATDNIKTAYVRRAVDILIARGEGLSKDELRCLHVVSNLRLDGACAESGQPMGSPMSFPLLCLINKTVVDLALVRLLEQGEVGVREYAAHPCLINGDDLLTRSTSGGDLVSAISAEGGEVGLRTNYEKTMRSRRWAEINSTVFSDEDGEVSEEKKTNVSALWMDAEVRDVVGYGWQSTRTARGLGRVVSANASRLARQKIKTVGYVNPVVKGVLLRSPRLRRALTSRPGSDVPDPKNIFPVEAEPDGFELSHEDVFDSVTREVTRLKLSGQWRNLFSERKSAARARKSVETVEGECASRKSALKVLQNKTPPVRTCIMSCLANRWRKRVREELAEKSGPLPEPSGVVLFDGESSSPFTQMKLALKAFKISRESQKTEGLSPPGLQTEFGDYVAL